MSDETSFLSSLFSNEGQWFWQALGTVIVGASLVAVFIQVRLQRMASMVDAIEKLVSTWNSENQLRLRLNVCRRLINDKRYFGEDSEELLELLERIGAYVRFGALSEKAVWEVFSWFTDHYYELSRDGIAEMRKHHGDPLLYENFEWLAVRLNQISRKRGLRSLVVRNETDAQNFLNAEINTAELLLGIATSASR